jgi:hypothetical protein
MKIQENEFFNAMISLQDANGMYGNFQHPQFYQFLQNIGNSMLPNSNNLEMIQVPLEQLSKDLNIKLMIYSESLVIETFSYEFSNPVIIYIYASKKADIYTYQYIFNPFERKLLHPIVTLPKGSLNLLNKLGSSLTNSQEPLVIKKGLIKNIQVAVKEFKMIQNEFPFIKNVLQLKERAGIIPTLRTANMNINELKDSKSYEVKFPEYFTKFVPVPDLNIIEESRKEGVKPEEDSDEEFVASDESEGEIDEKDIPPGNVPIDDPGTFTSLVGNQGLSNPPQQANPSFQSNPSPSISSAVRCNDCMSEPCDFFKYHCSCALCQTCMVTSYQNGICANCKEPLNNDDKSQAQIYFG